MNKPGENREDRAIAQGEFVNGLRQISPAACFARLGPLVPRFGVAAAVLCVMGVALGVVGGASHAPSSSRLLILFLPVTWMSLFIYALMLLWLGLGRLLNKRLSTVMAHALAPTGAVFSFLALWIGLLWFKSSTGDWLAWDALLTSELVLLFLYLMYSGVQVAIENAHHADRVSALLVVGGIVAMAIMIRHQQQPDSDLVTGFLHSLDALNGAGLSAMLLTVLGLWSYSVSAVLMRMRCMLLEQERHAEWAGAYVKGRL